MANPVYTQAFEQLPEFLDAISEADPPENFTQSYLKNLGFDTGEHRTFIPILKAIGFLSKDGEPTDAYLAYQDKPRSRRILGQALLEAYPDVFAIKAQPTDADRPLLERKFKNTYKCSDRLAKLMANTFFALLDVAEVSGGKPPASSPSVEEEPEYLEEAVHSLRPSFGANSGTANASAPGLHYNIQIHLPATKDIEVYNLIFKSLKEHLLD